MIGRPASMLTLPSRRSSWRLTDSGGCTSTVHPWSASCTSLYVSDSPPHPTAGPGPSARTIRFRPDNAHVVLPVPVAGRGTGRRLLCHLFGNAVSVNIIQGNVGVTLIAVVPSGWRKPRIPLPCADSTKTTQWNALSSSNAHLPANRSTAKAMTISAQTSTSVLVQ